MREKDTEIPLAPLSFALLLVDPLPPFSIHSQELIFWFGRFFFASLVGEVVWPAGLVIRESARLQGLLVHSVSGALLISEIPKNTCICKRGFSSDLFFLFFFSVWQFYFTRWARSGRIEMRR